MRLGGGPPIVWGMSTQMPVLVRTAVLLLHMVFMRLDRRLRRGSGLC